VKARLGRCAGPDMTEYKVRLTRRKGPDLASVKARLGQCVGHDLTEDKVCWARYPSAKKSELTHPKAKHLSFASRFGRQRPSREATTQNASAGTEVTGDGYRHLRFYYYRTVNI
jgi:hypothetical protein